MNSVIVAGLIAGVVVYLVDWVVWSKVFNTAGMEAAGAHMTPEEMKRFMGPALVKSAVLSLAFVAHASPNSSQTDGFGRVWTGLDRVREKMLKKM